MENKKHPTYGNGKICYLEIPSVDPRASANFYQTVFGWSIRDNSEGQLSFDDGVTEVSGTWVNGVKPSAEAGIVISNMVSDIYAAINLVEKNGGKIILPVDESIKEKFARFTDPYGNIMGLYEHKTL
jgi:predicted enzyme related to lactoylglutathione lyase